VGFKYITQKMDEEDLLLGEKAAVG